MTEFKRLMLAKSISNREAMLLFDKTERTITRYRSGEVEVPMLVMEKLRNLPSEVVAHAE